MRTREEDTKFLEECRTQMDVLLNEVQNADAGRLTVADTSSLVAWVKQQEYPLQGEKLAPILPERGVQSIVQIYPGRKEDLPRYSTIVVPECLLIYT